MSNPTKNKISTIVLGRSQLLILLALAFCFGVYVDRGIGIFGSSRHDGAKGSLTDGDGEYKYIRSAEQAKRVESGRAAKELKPFRYKVNALVGSKQKSGEVSEISVYFRDLRYGQRFGIREQERFSSDTLLKLPLMIAYLKWAESTPLLLNRKIVYTGHHNAALDDQLTANDFFEDGKSYKIDTLIYRMIAYNDSGAYALLRSNLPPGRLDKIFKDISVDYDPVKNDDSITFNAYASFFRILFNASYLGSEMSEKALRYLSKTTFKDGIISGVPADIDVVAKYGERMLSHPADGAATGSRQYHEFGIVYHPVHPYLVGIMVRGDDPRMLSKTLRDISALVYEEVDRQSR
jgi:beta-lactamase class A